MSRQLSVSGMQLWWTQGDGDPVDVFRTGGVVSIRAGTEAGRDEGEGLGSGEVGLAGARALLDVSVEWQETSLDVAVGWIRSALDVLSHVSLVHTRRSALRLVSVAVDEVWGGGGDLGTGIKRPTVGYSGHAKAWWGYAIGWTVEMLRRRRLAWRARNISQVC